MQVVHLYVHPLKKPKELQGRYLVVFEDVAEQEVEKGALPEKQGEDGRSSAKIRELEQELQHIRESHQSTVEELESSNEELKSTNEELQSSNEELQSTNEELESSKEEMQSLNEELQTVNAELQSKVEELSAAQDDMSNLLNGIEVAAIFVDNEMRIRRFTSEAVKLLNLIQSDIGRPLKHMGTNLREGMLLEDIRGVLDDLAPREREVQSNEDAWYLQRVVPYRTRDNRIDGAVITFLDIDDQKKSQLEMKVLNRENEQSRMLVRKVFDMNPKPLAVLDSSGALVIANSSFTSFMNLDSEEVEGTNLLSLENEVLNRADLSRQLRRALEEDRDFMSKEFGLGGKDGERRYYIRGQVIQQVSSEPYRLLLAFETIDE